MLILHGDNIVASRNKLNEITNSFTGEVIRLEGSSITLTDLKQATESASLFSQERLLIISNLFSGRPKTEKKLAIGYLKEVQPDKVVIWEGKTIDGRKLVAFKKAKIQKFEINRSLFKFLESLSPGNYQWSLKLLHQSLEGDSPQMVFFMLARQIRLLIIAKDLGEKGLEKMAPWQKNKLTVQSEKFTMNELFGIQKRLLKIDFEQKTSRQPYGLVGEIELLVIDL